MSFVTQWLGYISIVLTYIGVVGFIIFDGTLITPSGNMVFTFWGKVFLVGVVSLICCVPLYYWEVDAANAEAKQEALRQGKSR